MTGGISKHGLKLMSASALTIGFGSRGVPQRRATSAMGEELPIFMHLHAVTLTVLRAESDSSLRSLEGSKISASLRVSVGSRLPNAGRQTGRKARLSHAGMGTIRFDRRAQT